ncbi:aminoglycoside phosphotransferase family protein [Kitasatospora sp. NPDC093558]|uniref:phosphotransferase enzyme family protein n=1 Tax=Kitasatospora sp. NPDC093558 TaxID=3155201 RepID=UPI00342E1288
MSSEQNKQGDEQELAGGGTAVVVRIGDTVRKPVRPWSDAVHRLLKHLEQQGVDGVPRALGVDEQGRSVFSYLDGEVGNYPLSAAVRSERALVSAAALLRRYHDATSSWADGAREGWQFGAMEPVEVLCHGDFASYNCVFRGEEAVGIIDFDAARPGPRAWDLAYALYRFAPVTHPDNHDGFGGLAEQARRARAFLDAYGCTREERRTAMETVSERLQSLADFMQERAAAGDENFQRHIDEGHLALYLRDIAYAREHQDDWERLVTGPQE